MIAEISKRQMEIIDAAGKILTRSGVGGLTIKNLAKEMGFSESAIYRHFVSKEAIIIALLDFLAQSMDERYTKELTKVNSPVDQFIKLFENQLEFFHAHPHFVVAVFSDGLMEESKRINATISKIMGIKIKHLLPVIVRGQQAGVFNPNVPAEDLIQVVMGTFRLQMFRWRVANFEFDITKQGKKMMETLLVLLKHD